MMKNQIGAGKQSILLFVAAIVVIIAAVIMFDKEKPETKINQDYTSALSSLKVALDRANDIVNKEALKENVSHGMGDVMINNTSVAVFNGYIAATREDIKNALGAVFNGEQSIYPSTVNWTFQEIGEMNNGVKQIKIYDPSVKKSDCYLLYSQGGSVEQVVRPNILLVDSGC